MADERLPIKFFAKRDVDNMRVEAGGGGDPPKFVLSPEDRKSTRLNSSH